MLHDYEIVWMFGKLNEIFLFYIFIVLKLYLTLTAVFTCKNK